MSHKQSKRIRKALKSVGVDVKQRWYKDVNVINIFGIEKTVRFLDEKCGKAMYKTAKKELTKKSIRIY